jgi:hypothetical protein
MQKMIRVVKMYVIYQNYVTKIMRYKHIAC